MLFYFYSMLSFREIRTDSKVLVSDNKVKGHKREFLFSKKLLLILLWFWLLQYSMYNTFTTRSIISYNHSVQRKKANNDESSKKEDRSGGDDQQ